MKNERTSKRVAAIAGRILRAFEKEEIPASWHVYIAENDMTIGTTGDIKTLAASTLTQTADKPKTKAKKAVRR